MERLPVVEDLVAVVDDVCEGGEEARQGEEAEEREKRSF